MESRTSQPAPPGARNGGAPARPTAAGDYVVMNAAWGALLVGVVAATRERARDEQPIGGAEMARIAAATFALSKVIAKEKMGTWVREPFVDESPDRKPIEPRGQGKRHVIGELLTCTRCVGAWSALGLVGLRLASPPAGRIVSTVLATSAANDFLQASFTWLTAEADRAEG